MINIAICDDEKLMREFLCSLIEELCSKQNIEYEIVSYCSIDNYGSYAGEDILFLDIEMQLENAGQNGMELARRIRQDENAGGTLIIFVTGHEKYVYEAFDVGAFGYLLKPVNKNRFADVFLRAVKQIVKEKSRQKRVLLIENGGTKKTVRPDDLYYVESQNHKMVLHMKDEIFEYYEKMKVLQEELTDQFFRIHRSYLINLEYVDSYTKEEVVMINGDRLLISKYKYADFVKMYMDYISGK